jgi:hypothetical protein
MIKMAVRKYVDSALPSLCRFVLFEIGSIVFYLVLAKGILSHADSIRYKRNLIFYDCGAAGCVRESVLPGQEHVRSSNVRQRLRSLSPASPDLVLPVLKPV